MLTLDDLVDPLGAERFLAEVWPRRLYTAVDGERRLRAVSAVPELRSARDVLERYPGRVSLLRPDGTTARAADGGAAIEHYDRGFTCYLRHVSDHVPALGEMLDTVSAQLGVPRGSMTCEVFCSRGRSGVAMHSDYDVNFSVLLSGAKRWRLAPNRHVRHQTSVCLPGSREQRDPGQLELADALPFPDRMPAEATVVDVRPGGLVFLPRGWWHETSAHGECLQLNLVMKGPQWRSVAGRAVEGALVADAGWRDFAYGVAGDAAERERARDALAALVPGLRALLAGSDREVAERLLRAAGLADDRG